MPRECFNGKKTQNKENLLGQPKNFDDLPSTTYTMLQGS